MDNIFLSYRREDSEGQAGRLFEALRSVFGAERVFMDVATIEPGVDFRRVIERNTASCGVLLALIGRDWMTIKNDRGERRIDDPNDFVRLETAAALHRDIPVVPVLVQGAQMPREQDLPADLRDLAFRNGVELSHARWDSDVQLLVAALRKLLDRKAEADGQTPPGQPKRRAWPLAAGLIVALAAGGIWLASRGQKETYYPAVTPHEASSAASAASTVSAAPVPDGPASPAQATPEVDPQADAQRRIARQRRNHEAGVCISGYVWRQAGPGDKVCVTPAARADAGLQTRTAAARRAPNGGTHGPNTCKPSYVWREAYPGDVVCVLPAVREAAAADNAQAAARIVPAP